MVSSSKRFTVFLWAIMLILMSVLLVSHTYNDIVITTVHGMNLWDILFDGKFFQFYQLNITTSGNPFFPAEQGCAYNILVYIAFAIWNIPLALLSAFTDVDVMNNLFCLIYSKLIVVFAMAATAFVLHKILTCLDVPQKGSGLLIYLYLSSALMISVVFITSQYDLLGVIFQLLGFYVFIKGNRKHFVFYFGIAFCFKYFCFIIFLPLLFLLEKKLIAYVKYLVCFFIPVLITKIPFILFADSSMAMTGELMGAELLEGLLRYSAAYMNPFVVIYILVLVWSYLHGEGNRLKQDAVWACFASYAAFFSLCEGHPYWSILIAPFVILAIAIMPKHLYLNLFLETFGMAALVFSQMIKWTWCYWGNTMHSMMMGRLFSGIYYADSLIFKIVSLFNERYLPFSIMNSVVIAAFIGLGILSYPRKAHLSQKDWDRLDDCWDALVFRALVVTVLCLLPILSLFI